MPLNLLHDLKYTDDRINDAIQIVKDKQTEEGVWNLENSYNGKTIVSIEKKGKPSKWITLKALSILGLNNNLTI